MNDSKYIELKRILEELGSVVVAFSGGVDSALLLAVAHDVLGDRCLGITGISPSLAPEEYDDAKSVSEQIGANWTTVTTDEMSDPDYQRNDADRCYYCKRELFTTLRGMANERGFSVVVDGFNADDVGDWRPGERAGRERGVRSPLKEADLSKEDIRELSRRYGLSTAEKQSFACLASRLPYGTEVTPERLEQVASAETALRQHGFDTFRVRYHGTTARLELGPAELAEVADPRIAQSLVTAILPLGFDCIAVDLAGFRSGSQNEKAAEDLLSIADERSIMRRHGLPGAEAIAEGKMLRIRLAPDDFDSLWPQDVRTSLVDAYREIGYTYVAVDISPIGVGAGPVLEATGP